MEIHSHHHDHPQHKEKLWIHYALEFFMLFLAVFCGFLAENFREHQVEKEREKQFISSLINDLRLDTIWLNTVTKSATSRMKNLDSAILVLSELNNNEMPVSIYQNLRQSTIQIMFFPNNGTVTQLKYSGGMRLITNTGAVDSIEAYDRLMRRLEVRRDITNQLTHDFIEAMNKTIDGKDLIAVLYDSTLFKKKIVQNHLIKLKGDNVNELINESITVRLRAVSDTTANGSVKRSAADLIEFLKKEYHLE